MEVDIIVVTYNSEKWLKNLTDSIERQKNIDMKNISLFFVDNVSTDNTIKFLEDYKKTSSLKEVKIIKAKENLGFGKANNLGFKQGNAKYVFFLNPDTELEENSLSIMMEDIIHSREDVKVWEFRQKPYEHPKWYDILTGETTWCSGACFIIERNIFDEIGGFDEKIFMYCEDVDISWNVRCRGYKIKYVPKASIMHYCYKEAGEVKPTQYFYSIINNLNLRLKYGCKSDVLQWHKMFYQIMRRKGPFKGSRKNLLKKYIYNLKNIFHFGLWRFKDNNRERVRQFVPHFLGFDYELIREGAFWENTNIDIKPKVSILVRTCGRPNVLKETLVSLRKQTYDNIEIVIVEDGKNKSEKMLKEEFSDLNIVYKATDKKVGRCVVGNIAMEMASGEYLNFLDDDDLFYADHVETLVKEIIRNKEYKIAYSIPYEEKIDIISKGDQYEYKSHGKFLIHNKEFSRITLLTRNAFPIQAVMFSKEIYKKYGGFDLDLDQLEDWELWARYAAENRFLYVPKVTSVYRVPFEANKKNIRQEDLDRYYKTAREKILNRNVVIKGWDLLEEVKHI